MIKKNSIFAMYTPQEAATATVPSYQPATASEDPQGGFEIPVEYIDDSVSQTNRLLYQIRVLLFVIVILKIICLVRK